MRNPTSTFVVLWAAGFVSTAHAQQEEQADSVPARELSLPEDDAWQDDWGSELLTIEPDSLIPMESWIPDELTPEHTTFKTAAACRRLSGDWFAVAAIFTWDPPGTYPVDYLYYFIVDGLESSPAFGENIGSEILLDAHPEIRNVHCTSNRTTTVYVAWDRVNTAGVPRSTGRVAALNFFNFVWSAYAETGTYLHSDYEDVYAHRPRVAWRPGNVLLVASNQMQWDDPSIGGGSGMWFERFDASTGNYLGRTMYWDNPCNVASWDIRGTSASNFVVTLTFTYDSVPGYDWEYRSVLLDPNGAIVDWYTLDIYPAGLTPPSIPVLVYSSNPQNTGQLLHMRTASKAYWLQPDAQLAGNPVLYTSSRKAYAGCEYWGTAQRLAHSFTNYTYNKKDDTRHMHWSTTPETSPQESYVLFHQNFVPVACASAERQDAYDNEVLLVSKYSGGPLPSAFVYWSMEAEH